MNSQTKGILCQGNPICLQFGEKPVVCYEKGHYIPGVDEVHQWDILNEIHPMDFAKADITKWDEEQEQHSCFCLHSNNCTAYTWEKKRNGYQGTKGWFK